MGMAMTESPFHVLAVDDSIIDRKLIERLLKTSSYQVTTVDSGSKALQFLGLHEADPSKPSSIPNHHQEVEVNLIITDYCMPGMTGYDLLKRIKESSSLRNIPVVIMSSENVPSRINRCLKEGAEEFFLKPVRLSDVSKLRSHMMKARCQSPEAGCLDRQQPGEEEKQEQGKRQPLEEDEEQEQTPRLEEEKEEQTQTQTQTQSQTGRNKRKAMEEGLSPDRTRPRYSGLAAV